MIPLRDSEPSGTVPVVTILLILVNGLVWLYEVSLGDQVDLFVQQYGLTPLRFVTYSRYSGGFIANALVPAVSSLFLHNGWLHVIGNMWFLWIFGDNVEDRVGHVKYFLFYLICGVGACLLHVYFYPYSRVPLVGASGAISGVLGAYLLSFPTARVYTLFIIVIFIRFVEIPAFVFLIFWFGLQFLSGASELAFHAHGQDVGGVAHWAHIGGFVLGLVMILLIPKNPRRRIPSWHDHRPWFGSGFRGR
jgi:membrane associated rhomboid family serine protease